MADDKEEVTFSLNVMMNRERSKVLFAEADGQFADILLSFLTLPLGRIIKVLDKHYEDEAPTIGSLSSLYRSLANLDSSHFWSMRAKQTLLNPISSFDYKIKGLKLDVGYSPPSEYFYCPKRNHNEFRSVSTFYDLPGRCRKCDGSMSKKIVSKSYKTAFTIHKDSFIISDDLQILPNELGILDINSFLGITDMDEAESVQVDLGFSEIINLLKASLTSPTPLSDIILNKKRKMGSYQPKFSLPQIAEEENPNSRPLSLILMIQKSTGKFLYAQAKETFVDFLFSFLHIPLGGVENLLSGKTCVKAIDNLYRSTTHDLINNFKSLITRKRVMEPKLPHGCISKHHILPLTQISLPPDYYDDDEEKCMFSYSNFRNGQGSYLRGPRTYQVNDDLTVVPFCIVSTLSGLRAKRISISDVEEVG